MKTERKIILYIATSLDGFIARENGSVDWLDKYNDMDYDFGFDEFNKRFETVIVGNTTQKQYPNKYDGKTCYVFSRNPRDNDDNLIYVSGDVKAVMEETNPKGNIWLVGGADLVNQFIKYDLIDEYIITLIPEEIGNGIPLFKDSNFLTKLKTVETKKFGNIIQQVYTK
jgi:dihydrofolate reductase